MSRARYASRRRRVSPAKQALIAVRADASLSWPWIVGGVLAAGITIGAVAIYRALKAVQVGAFV